MIYHVESQNHQFSCLVGCQSKHLLSFSLVCGLWWGLKYLEKECIVAHAEAISWYIPIYSGYSYIHPEYMGIYHAIFNIYSYCGPCQTTRDVLRDIRTDVCIAVGVGDSWGHDTSPHWEPNCTCLNGMPLLSWVYLDILKPTDCKYYITLLYAVYMYIYTVLWLLLLCTKLFEMGINVPYMEHPIITCFWRGPSKSIDMHSCKIS